MRSSRDPYARRDAEYSWFLGSAWVLLILLCLMIPIYHLWPELFPGVAMWLIVADVVLIGLWTFSPGAQDFLQSHQVIANLGMMGNMVLGVIALAVDAPLWTMVVFAATAVGLAAVAVYRV